MMLRLLLFFILTAPITGVRAQALINITLSNVRSAQGTCNVGLYNTAGGFLDPKQAIRSKVVKAEKGVVKVSFDNVPAGTYAVAVIHDENNDATLNTNMIGIPKEGYGASNNNLPWTSAPSFGKAAFQVSGAVKDMVINLRYY